MNTKKVEVSAPKENEMFELVQEAVADLHRIADRLERYAAEQIERQNMIQGEDDA